MERVQHITYAIVSQKRSLIHVKSSCFSFIQRVYMFRMCKTMGNGRELTVIGAINRGSTISGKEGNRRKEIIIECLTNVNL
jgi:hypothetical protein